jgi:hypothetical protein
VNNAKTQAFELARMHGLDAALRMTRQWRDASAPGTMSFSLHNAVHRELFDFKVNGSMFRMIGESK